MATTLSEPIARHYRNLRRGYGPGSYPDGQPMPARYALAIARAHAKGSAIIADGDHDHRGTPTWEIAVGDAMVEIRQEDDHDCDCRDGDFWPADEPLPDHWHWGIVATVTLFGREVAYDGLWGFSWGWPNADDEAELAYAWEQVVEPVIEDARKMVDQLPAWVVAQQLAWSEEAGA